MDWYNGYNPQERNAMGRAASPPFVKEPPCAMCGDPSPPKMQTHAEDYSVPYRWVPPAAYPVCVRCQAGVYTAYARPLNFDVEAVEKPPFAPRDTLLGGGLAARE